MKRRRDKEGDLIRRQRKRNLAIERRKTKEGKERMRKNNEKRKDLEGDEKKARRKRDKQYEKERRVRRQRKEYLDVWKKRQRVSHPFEGREKEEYEKGIKKGREKKDVLIEKVMIDQSDEEINFYFHNHEGDLSDGSDNGGSGSSDNSDDDWDSSSDSSWHTSDSSDQTYSSDSGFSALEFDEPDSEMSDCIYRDAVGDPGDMFEPCEDCGALKLKPILHPIRSPGEISLKSLCCHGGKVDVEEESDPSPAAGFILDLWSRDDHVGYVFRKYARKINNAFSLASLYAKEEIPGRFNPSYKVRGKTYVRIGALMPGEQQERPAFSQIYIYDAEDDIERVEMRMGHLNLGPDVPQAERDLLRELFIVLQEKITACNPYVQQFKLAKDIDVEEELSLMFHPEVQTGGHARVYNAPSHELCVCAVNENTLPYPPIILRRSTTYLEDNPSVPELYSIHDCHPLYDIIRYLFFFPDGGEGWHRGRKRKDGKK